MPKRVCYIHVGPHKTATSSIQWFLNQNRAELLKHGYLVPDSGTAHGAHHPLARALCGQPLPKHRQSAAAKFVRELDEKPSDAVIISSETLAPLVRQTEDANAFFTRIAELNLEAKLVLFPRHQPQWINSRYAEAVRDCTMAKSFETFARATAQRTSFMYLPFVELADTYDAELIARPFTAQTIADGVVPTFLNAIGIDPAHFGYCNVRRNEAVGPFTVAVGRGVARALAGAGKRLKRHQAARCKIELSAYLEQKALVDRGYCGLTSTLAREIEQLCRADNDAFAQRVWGARWEEIFAGDVGREFTPNDLDLSKPDDATQRLLARALNELMPIVEEILRDPTLAVDESWNEPRQRVSRRQDNSAEEPSAESAPTV